MALCLLAPISDRLGQGPGKVSPISFGSLTQSLHCPTLMLYSCGRLCTQLMPTVGADHLQAVVVMEGAPRCRTQAPSVLSRLQQYQASLCNLGSSGGPNC